MLQISIIFMIVVDQPAQFIQENFLYLHPGYTLLNTIVFGIILGISVLIIIRMFKWIDKDPKHFLVPLIPFIFFGSSTRALVDHGIYPLNLMLVTPGIYVITGSITILTILSAVYIEKKIGLDFRQIIFITGVLLCAPNIIKLQILNWAAFVAVLGIWSSFTAFFVLLRKNWELLDDRFNLTVLSAHLFDASTTFVAVDFFGYWEQHVLPGLLTSALGTAAVMFPLKIMVILGTIYFIEKFIEDKKVKNMLKLAIFILGLAPGLRNFLTLMMGS